jgi:hypothetical protein
VITEVNINTNDQLTKNSRSDMSERAGILIGSHKLVRHAKEGWHSDWLTQAGEDTDHTTGR